MDLPIENGDFHDRAPWFFVLLPDRPMKQYEHFLWKCSDAPWSYPVPAETSLIPSPVYFEKPPDATVFGWGWRTPVWMGCLIWGMGENGSISLMNWGSQREFVWVLVQELSIFQHIHIMQRNIVKQRPDNIRECQVSKAISLWSATHQIISTLKLQNHGYEVVYIHESSWRKHKDFTTGGSSSFWETISDFDNISEELSSFTQMNL